MLSVRSRPRWALEQVAMESDVDDNGHGVSPTIETMAMSQWGSNGEAMGLYKSKATIRRVDYQQGSQEWSNESLGLLFYNDIGKKLLCEPIRYKSKWGTQQTGDNLVYRCLTTIGKKLFCEPVQGTSLLQERRQFVACNGKTGTNRWIYYDTKANGLKEWQCGASPMGQQEGDSNTDGAMEHRDLNARVSVSRKMNGQFVSTKRKRKVTTYWGVRLYWSRRRRIE